MFGEQIGDGSDEDHFHLGFTSEKLFKIMVVFNNNRTYHFLYFIFIKGKTSEFRKKVRGDPYRFFLKKIILIFLTRDVVFFVLIKTLEQLACPRIFDFHN